MTAIKQRNTKPELQVFRELRRRGIHFQRHYRKTLGTPDIAIPSKRLAVFIDGDFWHGFRYPSWKKRLNSPYWRKKIERNRTRDKKTFAMLRRRGWQVMRVWEHQLQDDFNGTVRRIERFVLEGKSD